MFVSSGLLAHGAFDLEIILALCLVVVSFAALALGIPLVSEEAIDALATGGRAETDRNPRNRYPNPLWLAGVGAVLLIIVTWGVKEYADTAAVLLVFGALFMIIVAQASSTHADVAIAVALAAIMGVTPHPQPLPQSVPPSTTAVPTLVAIGDSYMSGEGASIFFEGTDDGGGNQCRRAPTAWAALAAEDDSYPAFAFLACSGATTGHVYYHPDGAFKEIPASPDAQVYRDRLDDRGLIRTQPGDRDTQLESWQKDKQAGNLQPELVVVSLGGNDAGFSTVGSMCLAPGSCDEREDLWLDSLDQVRDRLTLAYAQIDETFPDTPVVAVSYPDPIANTALETPCNQVSLRREEREFIHRFLIGPGQDVGLNDVIRETSEEFGFHFLDMERALADAHLQLCDEKNAGRPGINFVGLRSVRGAAGQRFNPANWIHSSLHPNERGHAAMFKVFRTWREANLEPTARLSVSPEAKARKALTYGSWRSSPEAEAAASVDQAGQCDLFEKDGQGCRQVGSRWTAQQIGWMLLKGGLEFSLAAAAFAWLFSVGLFAFHRRRKAVAPPPTEESTGPPAPEQDASSRLPGTTSS